jgi:protein-S-isoprenylcysteine O-methyltransferase Ste14
MADEARRNRDEERVEGRDYAIDRPNRDKASSKATKATVILLLLVSAALVLIVTIGGWSRLAGARPLQVGYILIYLGMAYYVARWNRGVLPLAAALAIILGIFAAISGPAWFDRDKTGFSDPALAAGLLGLISLLIVPVQVLLIAFSMRGFQQAWNVEVEVPIDEARGRRGAGPGAPGRPATA